MPDDFTAQAAAILADAKWGLLQDDDFHPALDFRVMVRKLEDVPRELLDQVIATLSGTASFTGSLTEGKDYAGTWYQGHVWWTRQDKQADNLVTLWQCLVKGAGSAYTFAVPGANGTVTHTVFYSLTKAAVDALLSTLSTYRSNSCSPSLSREEGRWSGVVTTGNGTEATPFYTKTGITEEEVEKRFDRDGNLIIINTLTTYTEVLDNIGQSAMLQNYSGGGPGSKFSPLQGNWARYIKVTSQVMYMFQCLRQIDGSFGTKTAIGTITTFPRA